MNKIFCDICKKELPTKRKKKFLGFIDYWARDKMFALHWEFERELCQDCATDFSKWLKQRVVKDE